MFAKRPQGELVPRGPRSRQVGFSLVELLVTIVILAEVLIGLLIIFDSSSRLARAQTHVAELQQSLRVGQAELTRYARMAGLGGLPVTPLNEAARTQLGTFPEAGPAVSVFNNVFGQSIVQLLDPSAPDGDAVILQNSDVLVLRGVFSTPMFYVDPPLTINPSTGADTCNDNLEVNSDTNKLRGKITLPGRARISGRSYWDYPQDIDDLGDRLTEAKNDQVPLAFMLRDTLNPNAYVVAAFDHAETTLAELQPSNCPNVVFRAGLDAEHIPQCISFCVVLDPSDTTGPGEGYANLTAGTVLQADDDSDNAGSRELTVDDSDDFDISLPTTIGSIGLLEEYRLFVRAEWEVPGQVDTRLTPVLSRAEFLPGTNIGIDSVDIADNVLDLQIAIGADADPEDGAGYGDIREDTTSDSDEVLFNTVLDSDGVGATTAKGTDADAEKDWSDPRLDFHFLRINTLVQARFPDREHIAPEFTVIEDYDRGDAFTVEGVTHRFDDDHQYRRRWLQTVVELRNLL